VLEHPIGKDFSIAAEAVYLKRDDPGAGVGLDLVGLDAAMMANLEDFVGLSEPARSEISQTATTADAMQAGTSAAPPGRNDTDIPLSNADESASRGTDSNAPQGSRPPRNVHERIRQLSLRERETVGRSGTLTERVALEALLQNPQLTPPEVARIAKNGSLPIPLVSVIVNNASWLATGEVRRALLGNPRVSGQNLERVLRAFPKSELKQVAQMSAYRSEVRSAAQRLAGK
jgi:hypothetical protein